MKPAWLFLGALLILASQLTQAQDPSWPANIKRLWEATERHARITMQEELVTESEIVVAGFDRTLDRGGVGLVFKIKVDQVIDEENLRADLMWVYPAAYINTNTDETYHRMEIGSSENVWLEMSTRDMVDGGTYSFRGGSVFEVTGTKTYKTALGSKTVHVAKWVDFKPYAASFLARSRERKAEWEAEKVRLKDAEEAAKIAEANLAKEEARNQIIAKLTRTWRDKTLKFSVDAQLTAIDPVTGEITLKKKDGSSILLKTYMLQKPDRDFVVKVGKELLKSLNQ